MRGGLALPRIVKSGVVFSMSFMETPLLSRESCTPVRHVHPAFRRLPRPLWLYNRHLAGRRSTAARQSLWPAAGGRISTRTDRTILSILSPRGAYSMKSLAGRIGLSRSATAERVARLEKAAPSFAAIARHRPAGGGEIEAFLLGDAEADALARRARSASRVFLRPTRFLGQRSNSISSWK